MSTSYPYISILTNILSSVLRVLRSVISSPDIPRKQGIIRELTRRRALFKNEILRLDTIIRQSIPNDDSKIPHDHINEPIGIRIITDIDTHPFLSSRIASIMSSCPPPLLAEVREWQQAAHVIACIDTTILYISNAITQEPDPLSERICDAMVDTILTFPLPRAPRPAQQRPDDRERVMDRPVFYDEPQMRNLIASLDDGSRLLLKAAADRERLRLPLFPAHFSHGDVETKWLDEWSHSFDPENAGITATDRPKQGCTTLRTPMDTTVVSGGEQTTLKR